MLDYQLIEENKSSEDRGIEHESDGLNASQIRQDGVPIQNDNYFDSDCSISACNINSTCCAPSATSSTYF